MTTEEPRSSLAIGKVSVEDGLDIFASEGQEEVPSQNNSQDDARRERNVGTGLSENNGSNMSLNHDDMVGRFDERKIKHWKDSEFAVGCVNINWKDDHPSWWYGFRSNGDSNYNDDSPRLGDQQFAISSILCGCLGAGRVGNMAILAQSTENIEEQIVDPDTGQVTIRQKKRRKLLWVVGPYWTVNVFITFPLIFGISGWICYRRIVKSNLLVIITWSIGTFLMVFSLCMISCRNPGILYRHSQIPPTIEEEWRWNDQARTYRPASSRFDSECQVVVEGFDHTCPWTGTAIGSKNMFWFKIFVCMVPIMLVYTFIVAAFGGHILTFFYET